MDRYSFTVTDFHRLPPADLPAHRGSMAGLCPPLPTLRRRADANARLGADVDRYSFIVVDLHHLLLAGLPAHFESYMPSHAVPSLQVCTAFIGLAARAQQRERMRRSEDFAVVATSANRVDGRVSISTTSQFKRPGPLSHP